MATIGLNDGPFLVMTVSYEKGQLTIADPIDSKIPALTLDQHTTIQLAEYFPRLATQAVTQIVEHVRAYGSRYALRLAIDPDSETKQIALWVCNGSFVVKAHFTPDATEFFQWVLNDISHSNDHIQLDPS